MASEAKRGKATTPEGIFMPPTTTKFRPSGPLSAACVAGLAVGAVMMAAPLPARASTAVGWQYDGQGAGYWDDTNNKEIYGLTVQGSSAAGNGPIDTINSLPPPVSSSGGGAAPPNMKTIATTTGAGLAVAAVQVEYQSARAFGAFASSAAWVDYTLTVNSTAVSSVFLGANVGISLSEGGLSGAEVGFNEFAGAAPQQPIDPASSLVAAAVHDGEWFYINNQQGQFVNTRGSLGSNGLYQDQRNYYFRLATNTTYTFQISAWAWGGYLEGDYNGPHRSWIGSDVHSNLTDFDLAMEGTAAIASIDPVFFVVPQSGYLLSDYTLIGVPAGSNGDLSSLPGAVPEPSSWAMMLLGFAGLSLVVRRKARTLVAR